MYTAVKELVKTKLIKLYVIMACKVQQHKSRLLFVIFPQHFTVVLLSKIDSANEDVTKKKE